MQKLYVVRDHSINRMVEEVNEYLGQGWRLHGNIFQDDNGLFIQALVMEIFNTTEENSCHEMIFEEFLENPSLFIHNTILRNELYYGEAHLEEDNDSITDYNLILDVSISNIYVEEEKFDDNESLKILKIDYNVKCGDLYQDNRTENVCDEEDLGFDENKIKEIIENLNHSKFRYKEGNAMFCYEIKMKGEE